MLLSRFTDTKRWNGGKNTLTHTQTTQKKKVEARNRS